jgi:hypothetical protein
MAFRDRCPGEKNGTRSKKNVQFGSWGWPAFRLHLQVGVRVAVAAVFHARRATSGLGGLHSACKSWPPTTPGSGFSRFRQIPVRRSVIPR